MLSYVSNRKPASKPNENPPLTPTHERLYASERMMNFRGLSKLCATRSENVLTAQNLVSPEIQLELADLGEFAEIAYADAAWIFDHIDMLLRPRYPLEGYEALRDAKLVTSFEGSTAKVPTYVAYRQKTRQLVVGFSGTGNIKQALFDMCAHMAPHPAGKHCAAHYGFWSMYKGCQARIREALDKAFSTYHVTDVVCVGHSMGAALCYLLALDLIDLKSEYTLPPGLRVTVAAFGGPRVGNVALHERWQKLKQRYIDANAMNSVREFSVRANNDGIPTLPPMVFGYAHLALEPLYLYHGHLFYIPPSEREHTIFTLSSDTVGASHPPDYPRGGHHYYNGRSFERVVRRMGQLMKAQKDNVQWMSVYEDRVAQLEAGDDPADVLTPSNTNGAPSAVHKMERVPIIPETQPVRDGTLGDRLHSLVSRIGGFSRLSDASPTSRRNSAASRKSCSQSPVSHRGSIHSSRGSAVSSRHSSQHPSQGDVPQLRLRTAPRTSKDLSPVVTNASRSSSRRTSMTRSRDRDSRASGEIDLLR